jgi:p-cumate 2,3-dioxygenase subunit alpha
MNAFTTGRAHASRGVQAMSACRVEDLIRTDPVRQSFRVSRRAFADRALLEREQERIFSRCWLYVGHESEIRSANDFLVRRVGQRPVIFTRSSDNVVRAFLNVCAHRGAMVCREKRGSARSFTCIYHGWVYDNRGQLLSIEGAESFGEKFQTADVNLTAVPHLDSYRGFYFVNFDRQPQSLHDFLGNAREFIDLSVDMSSDGMEVIGGTQEYSIRADWKLLAENSLDIYHGPSLHPSYLDFVVAANELRADPLAGLGGRVYDLGNGHGVAEYQGPWGRPVADWVPAMGAATREEVEHRNLDLQSRHGKVRGDRISKLSRNLLVFPNLALIDIGSLSIRSFQPGGHGYMEVLAWALAPVDESATLRARRLQSFLEFLGPGGFATPDDIEVLESCQASMDSCWRDAPWNEVSKGMPLKEEGWLDEGNMRSFWREWARRMAD